MVGGNEAVVSDLASSRETAETEDSESFILASDDRGSDGAGRRSAKSEEGTEAAFASEEDVATVTGSALATTAVLSPDASIAVISLGTCLSITLSLLEVTRL